MLESIRRKFEQGLSDEVWLNIIVGMCMIAIAVKHGQNCDVRGYNKAFKQIYNEAERSAKKGKGVLWILKGDKAFYSEIAK